MSRRWSHVWRNDSQIGATVTFTAYSSTRPPEDARKMQVSDALLVELGIAGHFVYVGSGRGDWWDRTTNSLDPLMERDR